MRSIKTTIDIADGLLVAAKERAARDGTTHRTSTEELVHLIRAVGKTPVQRDTLYREVRVF